MVSIALAGSGAVAASIGESTSGVAFSSSTCSGVLSPDSDEECLHLSLEIGFPAEKDAWMLARHS